MSDLERLAKIEARHNSVTSEDRIGPKRHAQYVLLHEDMPWLLARVRSLEAHAARDARDARVAEAASRLIDEGVPVVAREYTGLECFYCGAVRYPHGIEHSTLCEWMALRAALAAREEAQ